MTTFTLLWVQCVLLLSLLVVVSDDSQRAYTLELVQVVHRHGSRSPLVTYNETKLCGLEFPCGYLNRQGQDMLVNTGRFLRTRYTTDDTVVDPSSPFLTQESYNLTVSYTRSTDVLRTLQSADALLRGLFPNMAAYYPAVHTVDPLTDGFLKSEGVPAVRVAYKYGIQEEHEVCWPVVDQNFTLAVLQSIAAEVHSQEWCSTAQRRMECARSLCDIGLAYQTTDTLSGYPLLKEYLTSLCRASICRNRHYASYNSTNPVQKQQGSYAQPLLQELVNKVNKTRDGSNTFKIIHYSTHESTLHPMVSALGDNSDLAMMPPFATTYVFELLRRATAAEGSTEVGDYAMRVKRGHPGVTPDTNFEFAWDDFELRCMHAAGDVYVAEGNVCPLEDFIRFIDSSKPTNAAGLCYIDPVLLARMKCPADAEETKEVLNSDCKLYRQQCPSYACGDGYRLDGVDYGCYKKQTQVDEKKGMSGGKVAGLSIGMFVLGALLAAAIVFLYWRRRYRRAFASFATPVFLDEVMVTKAQ